MKKILFLLFAVSMMFSCSTDDNNENLKVTYKSISGKWYFSQLVREDDSVVDHVGNCSTFRDYIEFFEYGRLLSWVGYADCVNPNQGMGCDDFYIVFDQNNKITSCNNTFDGAHITQLTKEKLKIELARPTELDMGFGTVKAFVFTKQ